MDQGDMEAINLGHIAYLKITIRWNHIVRCFCHLNIEVHCPNFDVG